MAAVNAYSWFDRLVHRIAFASPAVQMTAAEIEGSLFGRDFEGVETGPPVFVTSLPRAGTTILLTALNASPQLATSLYRDMPFVMAPVLWARFSGGFRKASTPRERAHGDGIAIGYDSPEAFEEVIWRAFWPEHVAPEGIALAGAEDARPEATAFLERHFRKIVALRCGPEARGARYISKNNANIARLPLLRAMFPGARILVPLRDPMAHAASLRRQHANFLARHAEDAFARRYMADIGHYEFGALHRPIRFPGLEELAEGLDPGRLDYWLAYWIAAFGHVEAHLDAVEILDHDALCARAGPAAGADLCALLGLPAEQAPAIGGQFRAAPPPDPETAAHRGALRERAEALHARLAAARAAP
jgi:hypothetical protein